LDKQNIVKRSMERVSLKRIEELLALENVAFFRVHKSYLINPDFLEEIKGKAQAYKLKLREFDTLVPVSRSYDISSLEKRMF
jgi:DNA-binding LytR/AlgR family response regulator